MNNPSCLFCQIVAGQAPADVIYQDEHVVAFRDAHPQAPVHVLVVPRQHVSSLADVGEEQYPLLGAIVAAINRIATERGIADSGYRVVVNVGRGGGQHVFHLHWHLLGGWRW